MLNGKYIILGAEYPPVVNPYAYGNAWFVESAVPAATPDEEIALLASTDLRNVAVIGADFSDALDRITDNAMSSPSDDVMSSPSDDVMSSEVETSPSRSFIIGGGQIYAQAIQDADRLIVTHVHTVIEEADTFFPEIDPSVWKVESRSELFHDEETGYGFEFVEYVRL